MSGTLVTDFFNPDVLPEPVFPSTTTSNIVVFSVQVIPQNNEPDPSSNTTGRGRGHRHEIEVIF